MKYRIEKSAHDREWAFWIVDAETGKTLAAIAKTDQAELMKAILKAEGKE